MEDLRIALRNLMQEMLLKKNLSSDEEFQHWWIDEGNEKRYFALQGRLEEMEERKRREKLLSYYCMNTMEEPEKASEKEEKDDL